MGQAQYSYYWRNREKVLARQRAYRLANPEKIREINGRYDKRVRPHRNAEQKRRYHTNPQRYRQYSRNQRRNLKLAFIDAYGGKCACCGEAEVAFLTEEHKNRDGKKHRTRYGTSAQVLADLRRRG